jgi:hypothetical protein
MRLDLSLATAALVAFAATLPLGRVAQAQAQPRAQTLAAREHWVATRFGAVCEAGSRPLPPSSERAAEARAGVRFGPADNGGFHVRLSRPSRPGASVILRVGAQLFLLGGHGNWAWSRGGAQGSAIVTAMRGAGSMRVDGRDLRGNRFSDRYLLAGAPTAIDAAAAACAGKI